MKEVAVIGAGTMGNGIAHVFAQHGFQVQLVDLQEEAIERALGIIAHNLDRLVAKQRISTADKVSTLVNIQGSTSVAQSVASADLVIEAASESLEVKQKIFGVVDDHAPEHCILASNTSSISITQLASATHRPKQVIGMQFMNPVPIMRLVEVIKGYRTSEQVTRQILSLTKEIGKIPVVVEDYPGFVANRILIPMINEAIYTLQEGVSGVEEIDQVMKLGMAHPMGPLQLADFIGLDVCLSILHVLQEGFGQAKYAPCPLLVNMVHAGVLGRKSGMGFYDYSLGTKELVVSPQFSN
ncbi:MAG: 3-hydroxybutyryl-CoA dehydrogenase [Saprospiraceae bacterium]|nr:3-hydroxybutyryl-CoA dehydrogenase [Saprospiraceae bacterium]